MSCRLLVILLIAMVWPGLARAQEAEPAPEAATRSVVRELPPPEPPKVTARQSPRSGMISLSVGPYAPERINPTGGLQFEDFYSKKFQSMVLGQWEWQGLRHDYVGILAVGAGTGFYRMRGHALKLDLTRSSERTTFVVVPAMIDVTYRLALVEGQPVVPYGGAGADLWYFQESKEGGGGKVSGAKRGWHWRAGGQLLLDAFDARSAGNLDSSWGINNTYLYGEYRRATINNFGRGTGFDLSDKTWQAGLMFEF